MRLDRRISEGLSITVAAARELIFAGKVIVQPPNKVISSPSWQVLHGEAVSCDGVDVRQPFHRIVFMNKPKGFVSDRREELRSKNVYDVLPPDLQHAKIGMFGRLDRDTTGLLLFGTDGGLHQLFHHPRAKQPKVYIAKLRNNLTTGRGSDSLKIPGLISADGSYNYEIASKAFEEGITLFNDTKCLPAKLEWEEKMPKDPRVRITLHEGKYHQVKRMLGCVGGHVTDLHREAIGELSVQGLGLGPPGSARAATEEEIRFIASMFPATAEVRDNPEKRTGKRSTASPDSGEAALGGGRDDRGRGRARRRQGSVDSDALPSDPSAGAASQFTP
eukprot:m.731900 g.731900  ORF g.731900 m.731900 type:complete len:332 (+) comp23063_c0_seq4:505-1500(+)